jgi:hypothetical protein
MPFRRPLCGWSLQPCRCRGWCRGSAAAPRERLIGERWRPVDVTAVAVPCGRRMVLPDIRPNPVARPACLDPADNVAGAAARGRSKACLKIRRRSKPNIGARGRNSFCRPSPRMVAICGQANHSFLSSCSRWPVLPPTAAARSAAFFSDSLPLLRGSCAPRFRSGLRVLPIRNRPSTVLG